MPTRTAAGPRADRRSAAARMQRALTAGALAVAVLAASGCTATPPDTGGLDAVFARIPDGEPGCAGAVFDDDRITWTGVRGFADVRRRLLITNDTVFGIGPATQQFTATAVLLLVQNGAIDLDDPIGRYLPELPDWGDDVTVRHLLQRTSGIPDYNRLRVGPYTEAVSGEDILRALSRVNRLYSPPGTRYRESWSESILQALLVEEVDGRALGQFLAEEVFPVAGIDAGVDRSPEVPGLARSYVSARSGATPRTRWEAVGDVGVYTTARELAEWGAQHWAPSVGGEELLQMRTSLMVPATSGARVTDEGPPRPGETRFGAGVLALREGDEPYLVRSARGDDRGFVSDLVVLPEEQLSAAVLCNHLSHDPFAIARSLLREYVDARAG